MREKQHKKKAFKAATTLLAAEKEKVGGMTPAAVVQKIEEDFEVKVGLSTIDRYVKAGDIGTSPKKAGNPGKISEWVFQTLCTATSSFIKINQLNAREVENDRKKLKARVLRVMEDANYVSFKLLDRILKETGKGGCC